MMLVFTREWLSTGMACVGKGGYEMLSSAS